MAYLPVPYANVPIIDPKTGLLTKEWYDVLKQLDGLDPLSKIPPAPPNVSSIDTATGAFTLSYGIGRSLQALFVGLTSASAVLGADVALNNTANYFDGPSVALGAGTWLVIGTVTLTNPSAGAHYVIKLWDGATVIASGEKTLVNVSNFATVTLAGIITSPAGNVKMSVKDITNTTGLIAFNASGNSKDSQITAVRLA